jgi:hypothetical protein
MVGRPMRAHGALSTTVKLSDEIRDFVDKVVDDRF